MAQNDPWTILKILTWTREYLTSKGVENARLEAEWMLCAVCGLDRVGLYLNFDRPLAETELTGYRGMVSRRGKREPLQHILGSQEFCGLDFYVTADVLIPRHDTEVLVAEALKRAPDATAVLDMGTGSGCIAVALKKQLPQAAMTATDISSAALAIAARNAERHGARIEFLQGSLFSPLAGRCFDLVVSNPPYIPTKDIPLLQPEVRDFDPLTALDGGTDGLDCYRALIPAAPEYLTPLGWLIVEVGIDQAGEVAEFFISAGNYVKPVVIDDSNCIGRVVAAQKRH
ncbi:MAG TPA: peptide chain release factor N(5)-glutamine methyltransferase [Desulfuromonadales bacterium]|nr:peptide chain release factor N(5)-glutamine methyltransferase [Desulfuromonadales bacterium]